MYGDKGIKFVYERRKGRRTQRHEISQEEDTQQRLERHTRLLRTVPSPHGDAQPQAHPNLPREEAGTGEPSFPSLEFANENVHDEEPLWHSYQHHPQISSDLFSPTGEVLSPYTNKTTKELALEILEKCCKGEQITRAAYRIDDKRIKEVNSFLREYYKENYIEDKHRKKVEGVLGYMMKCVKAEKKGTTMGKLIYERQKELAEKKGTTAPKLMHERKKRRAEEQGKTVWSLMKERKMKRKERSELPQEAVQKEMQEEIGQSRDQIRAIQQGQSSSVPIDTHPTLELLPNQQAIASFKDKEQSIQEALINRQEIPSGIDRGADPHASSVASNRQTIIDSQIPDESLPDPERAARSRLSNGAGDAPSSAHHDKTPEELALEILEKCRKGEQLKRAEYLLNCNQIKEVRSFLRSYFKENNTEEEYINRSVRFLYYMTQCLKAENDKNTISRVEYNKSKIVASKEGTMASKVFYNRRKIAAAEKGTTPGKQAYEKKKRKAEEQGKTVWSLIKERKMERKNGSGLPQEVVQSRQDQSSSTFLYLEEAGTEQLDFPSLESANENLHDGEPFWHSQYCSQTSSDLFSSTNEVLSLYAKE